MHNASGWWQLEQPQLACVIASCSFSSFSFLPPAPPTPPAGRCLQCERTTVCTARNSGRASWRQSGAPNSCAAPLPSSWLPAACRQGMRGWQGFSVERTEGVGNLKQADLGSPPSGQHMPAQPTRAFPSPCLPVPVAIAAVSSEASAACSWRSAADRAKLGKAGSRHSRVSAPISAWVPCRDGRDYIQGTQAGRGWKGHPQSPNTSAPN